MPQAQRKIKISVSSGKHYSLSPAAAMLTVILAAVAGWLIYSYYSSQAYAPSISPSTVSTLPSQTQAPAPNTGVTWRGQGMPIMADLSLISYRDDLNGPLEMSSTTQIHYYDMGTDGQNKIILAKTPGISPSGPDIFFFEQLPSMPISYRYMSAMSAQAIYTDSTKQGYVLGSKVTSIDSSIFYKDIVGPERLSYHGISFYQPYFNYGAYPSDLFSNFVAEKQSQTGVTVRRIDTIDSGDVYVQQSVSDQVVIKKYILKLKSGLYTSYFMNYPFISDDQIPQVTWANGEKNKDSFRVDAALTGCGNPGATVIPARDVTGRIHQTGTTSDGQAIYEFNNQNDSMVKFFYDLAGGKAYSQKTGQYDSFSIDEFSSHHAVILYKNGLGDYAIFTSNTYGPSVECGKPVVYLYPTKTTNVSVKVGANINISEPAYGNGWNVKAEPDGTLTTASGQTYNSLYWEGTGHGDYPVITEGTIVSREKVEETLKSQLAQLGLNKKESSDFLDFWLPKMPITPYTRLTWFTTSQMNELAPLAVWPRPDTTVRVFLDFQGLESPVNLPVQHLSAIARRGFTVVEWGGLLRK